VYEADADFDVALDAVLIGGREEREVVIVDYSPAWPLRFDEERRRIGEALGGVARRIEHVGSTAVPGLAAKPIVDVLVAVEDPEEEAAYVPALEAVGYVLRVREPGHRMFRTEARDVHVHIWTAGSEDERRHLLFRNRLRDSPDDRFEYERTKRDLAGRWRDVNYYARAKSEVIGRIMQRAERG
jgi:GrpB-like predicted nucleotidyltransferase (UPF0157 family)